MTDDIDNILEQRGSKYGPFDGHARATQDIKQAINESLNKNERFKNLEWSDQVVILEALDMIAHKIGRIVNGDPMYLDSWDDIGGYARLASQHISSQPPF